MNEILASAIFGILGGLVRAIVMIFKVGHVRRINTSGIVLYSLVMISIGAFSGIVLGFGNMLSFLGGYAGLDLMEGYTRTVKAKSVKFEKKK